MTNEKLTRVLRFLPVTLPNWLVTRFGIDKLVHGILTMYVVSVFNDFGVVAGTIALILMCALGGARERMSAQPDYSDVAIMFICGFVEMVRYCLQSIVITEVFGLPLQFV